MTGFTTITKRSATLWIVVGLIAGLALALTLAAFQEARADGHKTGTESIALLSSSDTDYPNAEVNFVAGTSRSAEEVWIRGSGFTPGREVVLLLDDYQGALYIISNCRLNDDRECNPSNRRDGGGSVWPLIVNDDGAFATSWRVGRFTRSNVGAGEGNEERLSTLWAVDGETYESLASAPLALCNLERNDGLEDGAERIEAPAFCSK